MSDATTYLARLLADEPSGIGASAVTVAADDGEAHELIALRNGDDMYDVWKADSTKIEHGSCSYELLEHNMPDPGEAFLVTPV
ncbi:hypothetical protein [Herbiconiux ginsengi]|uniref:Uncharacterized protein n=1 Tax=Herbiconiux ginsengi TaxID=381665 RepID=A0A1H3QP02_9MICO|nr:hypothetical protein [Herbiconiux ginsengi]SDZ14748.1 hypothetical protein SAMN05216554_2633 [Herbiconiux ginsengi]